ncbi:MAG: hypothetical protein FWF51_06210 [Chitinivibrionia bacterium]|nr:hypothetical protein [Chitinivibrionia bacterium]
MNYTDEQLNEAIKYDIFSEEQVAKFREFALKNGDIIFSSEQVAKSKEFTRTDDATKFQKTLYYGGGLLIISAMTWLMKISWDGFGINGIIAISTFYFIAFLLAGNYLQFKKNMEVAGGILFSVAVAMTPLLTFSILKRYDFFPMGWSYDEYYVWIKGKWIVLEISTILVALPILFKARFPFIVFLIAGSLWFFSMDIVPIIQEKQNITWTQRAEISNVFGFLMIAIGYFADIKFKKDYSFWMYLFGLLTLSAGLSVFESQYLDKLIIFGLINVLMILFALFVNRDVFIVFGTLGIMQFLGRLSWEFFRDSALFPFYLTITGILLIAAGIFFQKNRKIIEENVINKLPNFILDSRPKRNL